MSLLAVLAGSLLGSPVAAASPATFSVHSALLEVGEGDAGSESEQVAQTTEQSADEVAEQVEYLFDFEIAQPVSEPVVDLRCARGCVLEYHACMWSEWSTSCELDLGSCSETCG